MKNHHYSLCLLKLLYLTHISMSFDDFATPDLDGGRFSNPKSFTNWTGVPGLWSLMKWKLCETDESDVPTDEEFLNSTIPVHPLKNFESQAKLYASWLGHATVLVGLDGAKFITDPVWSQRASPVSFNGPLRYRPPPMLIEDVPELDFGVISHDHYDHLDVDAVKKLSEQSPRMRWFVPLGMEEWMRSVGIMNTDEQSDRVVQMNWGESRTITIRDKEYTIWCLPAQHWCQRGAFDRNKRLWSGWAVVGPTKKFYYTGDTGNCDSEFDKNPRWNPNNPSQSPLFHDKIGKNLGPFDLCAIPIGAYEPRWFMKSQHIGPVEAFQIHETVKSKFSIGIHWGTYHMGSYEYYLRPKQWIEELSKESKNSSGIFTTIEMGKVWEDLA